jgi:hypothetical protein
VIRRNSKSEYRNPKQIRNPNFDEFVKSHRAPFAVIPAKAGIQLIQDVLDPGFRRGDDQRDFLRTRQLSNVRKPEATE